MLLVGDSPDQIGMGPAFQRGTIGKRGDVFADIPGLCLVVLEFEPTSFLRAKQSTRERGCADIAGRGKSWRFCVGQRGKYGSILHKSRAAMRYAPNSKNH